MGFGVPKKISEWGSFDLVAKATATPQQTKDLSGPNDHSQFLSQGP